MKNLKIVPKEKVEEYLYNLWRTPEFREAQKDEKSYLHSIIKKFITHPRFFIEPDKEVENGHFYSWMNTIDVREYDNPYIYDLYILHEIYHAATMPYQDSDFYTWACKIYQNELEASIASEVAIYWHMRQEGRCIRDKSFQFPIWADQIINEEKINEEELVNKRRLLNFGVGPKNPTEQRFGRYAKQNYEWANIWKKNYSVIEKAMKEFIETKDAQKLLETLNNHKKNGVWFYEEATEFHEVKKTFEQKYGRYTEKWNPYQRAMLKLKGEI